jgi:hypothetical protein
MLPQLPEHLLMSVCLSGQLGAGDLAALEATSRHFRAAGAAQLLEGGAAVTVAEAAAERLLARRADAWRVSARAGESQKYLLHVLERRLAPLAIVAAGGTHSLAVGACGLMVSCGNNDSGQLGCGLRGGPSGAQGSASPPPSTVRRPLCPLWRPFWLRFTYVTSVLVKKY